MSKATELHEAVRRGDVASIQRLLEADPALANARSETDARGTYPLHVAAEFDRPAAARLLVEHGADLSRLDAENDSIALCWAAFYGRPEVTRILIQAGSELNQRNKHGLTPLGCAVGGTQGRWRQFSKATLEEWVRTADLIRARGGQE
jgi:ankyrin repeat protein